MNTVRIIFLRMSMCIIRKQYNGKWGRKAIHEKTKEL